MIKSTLSGTAVDTQELQRRIDQISWYHEFDFPGGLVARSRTSDVTDHRRIWHFIEQQLDQIEFAGKSVLDLGCWDGYWSFYAERRGARRVLASDDRTQNWAGSQGLLLAKELLNSNSSVDARLDVSVYDLTKLQKKFDIILCMGIYYHLVDPFYAFSQIRHLCHNETVVVFEGDGTFSPDPSSIYYNPSDPQHAVFIPTERALRQMLEANYFRVVSLRFDDPTAAAINPTASAHCMEDA
jgi:tRNA (mo5U34)-methyltransferase